jgi:hypothetical protein
MGIHWSILTPLPGNELIALEQEYHALADEYLAGNPECDDSWGEASATGPVPSEQEVRDAYTRYHLPLPDTIVKRLATCRSVLTIDRPGELDESPLQASLLRHVLKRAGKSLVMLVDYPLQTSEVVQVQLRRLPAAPGFDELGRAPVPEAEPEPPSAPHKEQPGERRAARIIEALQRAAAGDADARLDMRRALERSPELARRYAQLVVEEGAIGDAQAAKDLGVNAAELARVADQLAYVIADSD